MTDRYVHTIWCDDIRQEMGNKPSFMGVYTAGIVFPSLPAVVPRLSVYSWVTTPIDKPFKTLGLKILRDDLVLVDLPSMPVNETAKEKREGASRMMYMVGVNLGAIELPDGAKFFNVFVEADGELLEGTKLHIDVNPTEIENSPSQ